jgi:hypothetical protein
MNQLQYHVHRVAEAEGTIVFSAFLVDGSGLEYPRVGFSRNADGRIALSVLEKNVIVRLVLFD